MEQRSPQDANRLVVMLAGSPNRLMLTAWAVLLAAYLFGPLTYHRVPAWSTWAFVALCLLAFLAGGWLEGLIAHRRPADAPKQEISNERISRVASVGAWLGIAGIVCIAIDKLLLSGLDYSQGITTLRLRQIAEMDVNGFLDVYRSPLLYAGFLIVGFSVPAYLLFLLRPEALSTRVTWLVHAGLLSQVGIAVLYGGRSPMVLLTVVLVGALIFRSSIGLPFPYSRRGVALMSLAMVASVLYYHNIFIERRALAGTAAYLEYLPALESPFFNVTPSETLVRWTGEGYLDGDALISLLQTHFYFTHQFSALDATLSYRGPLGPYFGQYQLYLLSALVERFEPSLSLAGLMRTEARASGVYGWFSTAWGAMYLDFGYYGALLVTFFSGWFSAAVFRKAVIQRRLEAQVLACFIAAGILITPSVSPLTVSVALPILGSMVVSAWALRRERSAQVIAAGAYAVDILPSSILRK